MPKTRKNKSKRNLDVFLPWTQEDAAKQPVAKNCFIIIPFRDSGTGERHNHLNQFITHFNLMRSHLKTNIHLLVIEQSADGRKFNRGALLNIGARLIKKEAFARDLIILHDVDVLPTRDALIYYERTVPYPLHLGWAWTGKYNFSSFYGGVNAFSVSDFFKIGGFPNNFWGWGGEDNVLFSRTLRNFKHILRPVQRVGMYEELKHPHAGNNPSLVVDNKREKISSDRGQSNVFNVKWNLLSISSLGPSIKKLTVDLGQIS
jgi:hypothetical protein